MRRSRHSPVAQIRACPWLIAAMACGDATGVPPSGESPKSCDGMRPLGSICITQVEGNVVDESDQPVSDLDVTVCGPICFRGTTDESGEFAVEVNHFLIVSEYSVQAHGSPGASTFYHRLPSVEADGEVAVGTLRVVGLPADGPLLTTKLDLEEEQAPAQSVTSGGVSLDIGEGTVVRLSIGDALAGEEGARFRAHELTSTQIDEFAPHLGDVRLFAMGPFEADFLAEDGAKPDVSLRVESTEDWQPGSTIEVFALGTYLDPDWLTPSEFETIGTATVSADGRMVELLADAEGPGLRHLTWIGLRR